MALQQNVTRPVNYRKTVVRSIKRGVGPVPVGRPVKHRKFDGTKTRTVARPAQGRDQSSSSFGRGSY